MDKKELSVFIGGVLKKRRAKERITQRELSQKIGVSRALYALYEGGKICMPTFVLYKFLYEYEPNLIDFVMKEIEKI